MNTILARLFAILLLAAAMPRPALAATTDVPSNSDLQHLVQTLQDPAQRDVLIGEVKALIAVQKAASGPTTPPGGDLVALLSTQATRIGASVMEIAHLSPLSGLENWASQILAKPQLRLLWARSAGLCAGILLLTLAVGHGLRLGLRPLQHRLRAATALPVWERALAGCGAVLLGWLPALALAAAGYTALAVGQTVVGVPPIARSLVLAVVDACALSLIINATAETLLLTTPDGARLLPVGEGMADYWLVWIQRLSRFGIYGWFSLAFVQAAKLNTAAYAVLQKAFGLAMTGLVIMVILQNRTIVARMIYGPAGRDTTGGSRLRIWLGDIWHIVVILYLLGMYGVWATSIPGGFAFLLRASLLSLVILVLARAADSAGMRLAIRFFTVRQELEQRLPGLQKRVNLYAPVVTGTWRLLLYVFAGLLVLQGWGVNVMSGLETSLGQRLIGGFVTIMLSTISAVLVWEAVSIVIELYFSRSGADGVPLEQSARIRTLLPLFRKTLAIILGIAVGLVALATLGVDIGPLLAGAGIAGIAIGFGAQSLVKDVITGMFILMQDAVSVGDVVTVAGNSGLVEQISIRSIRLRNVSGTVIIIPFSEVTTVENMTKEFSYAVFDIGIAYREDVDEVIKVIEALGAEMQADENYANYILKPIEVLGLDQFADSAVIIKARIMTQPIQQWKVMREFNRRMKRRFDELNIEIPFPQQTIYFGADKQGNAPPAHLLFERQPPTS
ncbi:MAG: mechanosensitive ion channel [Acidocella sp.]|nr:mechanosensitive ion channel [Acidocella sp.]